MGTSKAAALRSRALRALGLGIAAGGAAVVAGLLLGGAAASADDGALGGSSGVIGGVLDGIDETVQSTGAVVHTVTDAVVEVATPVLATPPAVAPPAVAPPVVFPANPAPPVTRPVVAAVQDVRGVAVQAVSTVAQTAAAVPVVESAQQIAEPVDRVVDALPVVGDIVEAPVQRATAPIATVVDEAIDHLVQLLGERAPTLVPDPTELLPDVEGAPVLPALGVGQRISVAVEAVPSTVSPFGDAAASGAGQVHRSGGVAGGIAPRTVVASPSGVAGSHHGGSPPSAPSDGQAPPATAGGGSASTASVVADTSHAARSSEASVPRSLDHDLQPASAVGDLDTSPA